MKRRSHRTRIVGLLAMGSTVFLFGGCSLDGFLNSAQVGFAEQIGAFAADLLLDRLPAAGPMAGGGCVGPGCTGGGGET